MAGESIDIGRVAKETLVYLTKNRMAITPTNYKNHFEALARAYGLPDAKLNQTSPSPLDFGRAVATRLREIAHTLLHYVRMSHPGEYDTNHKLVEVESQIRKGDDPGALDVARQTVEGVLDVLESNRKTAEAKRDGAFREIIKNLVLTLKSQFKGGGNFLGDIEQYAEKIEELAGGEVENSTLAELARIASGMKSKASSFKTRHEKAQQDFANANSDIEKMREELEVRRAEATTDDLTGVFNRRALNDRLEEVVASYDRYGTDASLVLFDIDHFKSFNDEHGHQAGDEVLQTVGQTVKRYLRRIDFLARYGGEEFVVILPSTDLRNAAAVADKLRSLVEGIQFKYKGVTLNITVSCGVAQVASNDTVKTLMERADAAMYTAKHGGRNCTRTQDDLIDIDSLQAAG